MPNKLPTRLGPIAPWAVAVLFATALAAPARAAGPLTLESCEIPGLAEPARCGSLRVPEDRDAGTGREVSLRVVVIPTTGEAPARRAVAFIAGGPGDSSTRSAAGVGAFLADLRREADLLLVDLRGTGGSLPLLRCPYQDAPDRRQQYLDQFMSLGDLAACRRELERVADLTLYTTPYAVDDLDDVRAALGYDQLDLIGASYGTRAALVYARRHPAAVRTLTLLGPVPTDAAMPLPMAKDFDASLAGTFAACRADESCRAAFPDLESDLGRAVARLDAGVDPVEVTTTSGDRLAVPMTRVVFAQALRYMHYAPAFQTLVPYAVHRASGGDFEPAAAFAAMIGGELNRAAADGLYLSVTCAEDVPWFTLEEGRAAAAGTLLGEFRVNQQKAACALWPRGRLPEGYRQPVEVSAPALLVVGELDPASPPRWAREIAAHLPNGRVVVVPQAGHETEGLPGGECIADLPIRFIEAGTAEGLDLACAAGARIGPWQTAPPAAEVALTPETLAELAGTYASPDGLEIVVALRDGALEADAMGRRFRLVPVGDDRFRIDGAPPGFALVAVRDEAGTITGVVMEQGGAPPHELARRDD